MLVPPGAGAGRLTHARARTGQARRLGLSGTPRRPSGRRAGTPAAGEGAVSALVEVVHFADPACPWDYSDFRRRFGMPLCTADRPRLHGSRAAARMVKAADMQGPAAGAALLQRLRLAWFVEVRSLDDRELLALAAELGGIDFDRLAADFAGATSLDALHADMALARRPDRVALALGKTAAPPGEPGAALYHPHLRLRGARPGPRRCRASNRSGATS
jgi:hypothetical protein